MGLFDQTHFTTYREQLLGEAQNAIFASLEPRKTAAAIQKKLHLDEVSLDWSKKTVDTEGETIVISIPYRGDPFLLSLRVSTNGSPAPNVTLTAEAVVFRFNYSLGERQLLGALTANKAVIDQHLGLLNQGIRQFNTLLESKVAEWANMRQNQIDQAAKIADRVREMYL